MAVVTPHHVHKRVPKACYVGSYVIVFYDTTRNQILRTHVVFVLVPARVTMYYSVQFVHEFPWHLSTVSKAGRTIVCIFVKTKQKTRTLPWRTTMPTLFKRDPLQRWLLFRRPGPFSHPIALYSGEEWLTPTNRNTTETIRRS